MNTLLGRLRHQLLEKQERGVVALTMEELLGEAAAAIRSGSPAALETLARGCASIGQSMRPTAEDDAAWRQWYGAQCMAIAKLSRLTLLERMPFEVVAALAERKNLTGILRQLLDREKNLSLLGQELDRDPSQLTREVDLLVRLKLVESIKNGRQRWLRLTPMGRQAAAETGMPLAQQAPIAAAPLETRAVAVITADGAPSPLAEVLKSEGFWVSSNPGEPGVGATVVVVPPLPEAMLLAELKQPTLVFVDSDEQLDATAMHIRIDAIRAMNDPRAVALQMPRVELGRLTGVIDLLDVPPSGRVPDRERLMDAIVQLDDLLLEKYLSGQAINSAELQPVLWDAVAKRRIIPILCGSIRLGLGTSTLIRLLNNVTPRARAFIDAQSPAPPLALPVFILFVEPSGAADREKLERALSALLEENPELDIEHDPDRLWTTIGADRKRTLERIAQRLVDEHGIKALLMGPSINYRQTVRRAADGEGKNELAVVRLHVEPVADEGDVEITGAPPGIPSDLMPPVLEGIRFALRRRRDRPPMARLRVTLLSGEFHEFDSTPPALLAAFEAARDAIHRGDPFLLEPALEAQIVRSGRSPLTARVAASELDSWLRMSGVGGDESDVNVRMIGYQPAGRHSEVAEEIAAH